MKNVHVKDVGPIGSVTTELGPMTAEHFYGGLHSFMTLGHDAHQLKLLNVGTARAGEHHWRFKTSSGDIVVLKMEVERPGT